MYDANVCTTVCYVCGEVKLVITLRFLVGSDTFDIIKVNIGAIDGCLVRIIRLN